MRKSVLLTTVIALILSLALAACGSGSGDSGSGGDGDTSEQATERPKIRIGLDNYQYSRIPAYLGLHILQELGYDAEIKNADVGPMFQALARGDVDFYVDAWPVILQRSYFEQYEGQIEVIGDLYTNVPLGVGVPGYAPASLQSIEDLNDHIDFTGGVIYALEPGAGMTMTTHQMVEDYDLDYKVQEGSEAAMLAEMARAYSAERGVVFLLWRPHTMFAMYDIRILDDPKQTWGSGDSTHSIAMHSGFDKEAAPEAFQLYSNMKMSIEEIEAYMLHEDESGMSPDELAEEWIAEHPDRVKEWLGPYADQWDPQG